MVTYVLFSIYVKTFKFSVVFKVGGLTYINAKFGLDVLPYGLVSKITQHMQYFIILVILTTSIVIEKDNLKAQIVSFIYKYVILVYLFNSLSYIEN